MATVAKVGNTVKTIVLFLLLSVTCGISLPGPPEEETGSRRVFVHRHLESAFESERNTANRAADNSFEDVDLLMKDVSPDATDGSKSTASASANIGLMNNLFPGFAPSELGGSGHTIIPRAVLERFANFLHPHPPHHKHPKTPKPVLKRDNLNIDEVGVDIILKTIQSFNETTNHNATSTTPVSLIETTTYNTTSTTANSTINDQLVNNN